MEPTVTKVSDNSIEITKEVVTTQKNTYSYGDLIKQRETIETQKAREIEARDKEIAEVEALIAECEKLGMKTLSDVAPVEVIK
jgi:hypothetical protein